jgi:hypothetical protein
MKLTTCLDLMPMLLLQGHFVPAVSGELLEEVVNPAQVDAVRLEDMYSSSIAAS